MPNEEAGRGPRTISYWWVVAIAVVLFAVGIFVFIGGDTTTPTSQVEQSQRRPITTAPPEEVDPEPDDPDASVAPVAPEPTVPTAVTLPGGAPAPEGVGEVLLADGALTLALVPPAGWTEPTADPTPRIAPVSVQRDPVDGSALILAVGCAGSAGEYLAQVSVTEAPSAITVMAVALQPGAGAPCDPTAGTREFRLPLTEPVGSRPVIVVPAGPVPG